MIRTSVLSFVILGLATAKPQSGTELKLTEGRIIGGEEAPKHEFPWQVSLKSFGSHICGGSVVNRCRSSLLPIAVRDNWLLWIRLWLEHTTETLNQDIKTEPLQEWNTMRIGTLLTLTTTSASSP